MGDSLHGVSILLVEDEFLILLDLEHILGDAGAHVVTATSLSEAIEATEAGSQHFDVAVLDVRLPDGDVYPVAHRLAQRKVPLVFHSGHAHNDNLHEAFPDAVALEKPARERILLAAVEGQVAGR